MELVVKNKHGDRVCQIDEEDLLLLVDKIVYLRGQAKYVAVKDRVTKKQDYLHRIVVGAVKGQEVDHINRDKYDNRKCNLRIVTRSQNCCNSRKKSGQYKGVTWHKGDKRWRARVQINGKVTSKYYFNTQKEAAEWYDQTAARLHGEFAVLNFPDEDLTQITPVGVAKL